MLIYVIYLYHRGFKGFKSLDITVVETRGQKYLDGDSHQNIKAIYHWTPVIYLSIYLSIYQSIYLSIYLSIYRSFFMIHILKKTPRTT